MELKRPMLACSTIPEIEDINYPVMASPKLDGIRCLMINGVAYSRNLKPIPNKFIQKELAGLHGLDGELMIRTRAGSNPDDFNNVQSAVMSQHGEPKFYYVVFDKWSNPAKFKDRSDSLQLMLEHDRVELVEQRVFNNALALYKQYQYWLSEGYEGAIVRDMNAPYKQGRSTMKQGWMLKLKDFKDDEAVVVGFEELMRNENEATTGELGQTTRSHEQAGMVPGGTLGAIVVAYNGKSFKVGTGFDVSQRAEIWAKRKELVGKEVTFKYQELSKYGIPRFPVFKTFRGDK